MRGFGSGSKEEGSGSMYTILSRLRDLAQMYNSKIVLYRTGNVDNLNEPKFDLIGEYSAENIVSIKRHLSVDSFKYAGNVYKPVFQVAEKILRDDSNSICILLTDGIFSPTNRSGGMDKEEEKDVRFIFNSLQKNKIAVSIHHFKLPYNGYYPYPSDCNGDCNYSFVNNIKRNIFLFSFGKSGSLSEYHKVLNSAKDPTENPRTYQLFTDNLVCFQPFGSSRPIDNKIKLKVVDPLHVFDIDQFIKKTPIEVVENGKVIPILPNIERVIQKNSSDTIFTLDFKDFELKDDKKYSILFKTRINNEFESLFYKNYEHSEKFKSLIDHNKTYKLEVLLNAYREAFESKEFAAYHFSN